VLELNGIDTYLGPAHILHGLSLRVDKQEVVCLVGRNGAGKTTTIESIMGFLPLRAGQITYDGKNLTRSPPHARAKHGIGYSAEDCGIFLELSVGENLMISRWIGEDVAKRRSGPRPDPETQAFAIFPEVKNLTFAARPAPERRAAQDGGHRPSNDALTHAAADAGEAFEGLAPVIVNRFTDAVLKIKAMGVSILMAESHLAAATRIGDRLYAIDRGEIIFQGSPKDALADEKVVKALRG
jgi:branched-chain amino acid transport system ATP-binding protein